MVVTQTSNSEPLIQNDESMSYRPLGKTVLKVSALSFGCMRLGEDQELNTRLISKAIDMGVNYFETTRSYCGGQCQHRTAPGLTGKTAGIIVSGKAGVHPDTTAYSYLKEIELQLQILGVSHFKFFQVGWFTWGKIEHLLKRGGALDAIRKAQDEGLIHHVGFTGHDSPRNFIRCIETGLFDSITVPYNLLNREYEPTIRRAGELGVGVVAMCPVAGGTLGHESEKMKKAFGMDLPTPAMALRFVLSNPDVSTACSGMNTLEQLEQNVPTAKEFEGKGKVSFEEMCGRLDQLHQALDGKVCTSCGYCMPCKKNVNIPDYMDIFRLWKGYGFTEMAKSQARSISADQRLSLCDKCGACEAKCPNKIPVRDRLGALSFVYG